MIYVVTVNFKAVKTITSDIGKDVVQDNGLKDVLSRSIFKTHTLTEQIYAYRNYVIEAESIDKAKAIAEEGFYKDIVDRSEDNITFCILSFSTKPYEIMTATNGHDKSLVERINYIYSHDKEAMNPIIGAMYFRDKEMADIEGISEKDFHHDFDSFCESFLMTICDDNDLRTIINFVRLKNNKGQTLYADGWV